MTTINEIELEPLNRNELGQAALMKSPWPFLGSVKVNVTVRVGGTEATVAQVLELRQGAVLELDRLIDQPLDVMVDGHVVARGSLVAVGDHFGVRITETAIASPV